MDRGRSRDIAGLLEENGPSLTTALGGELRAGGVGAAAARKRLSRLPETVRVLRGLPFPRRSRFIYLESQFNSQEYWSALIRAVETGNPAYAAAIAGVRARGGAVPKSHFGIVSGAPIRQKGQIASSVLLKRLQSVELLSEVSVEGLGECILLGSQKAISTRELSDLRARLLTEDFLLDAMRAWLGRMNMASPNATRIRDLGPLPQFSTFQFDLCGPSYLKPLTKRRDGKIEPGFFVADVILGRNLKEEDVKPFIRKCNTLSHLRKLRPFAPMLIADGFSREGLHLCRSNGVIATTPESLFGRDVARALADLLRTLSKAAAFAAANPDKIEQLFNKLSVIEGAAGNLRGALFEILVGCVVHSLEGGSLDVGALIRDAETGRQAEIDVRLVVQRNLKIYECKGYQPNSLVTHEEIKEWLEDKIPMLYRSHVSEQRFHESRIAFNFWTCGKFAPAAEKLLATASARTKKYEIHWMDGQGVRQYISKLQTSGIRKIFDEHYLRHPIASLPPASNP